jgi:RNA polymerase sigma factor (TIGR02999 family)
VNESSSDPPAPNAEIDRLNSAFDALYRDLHSMAHAQLRGGSAGAVNTTILVHELYLRMANAEGVPVADPRHFLAYASNAMRFVVVDMIRAQRADKRGGGAAPLTLNTNIVNRAPAPADEILRVHESLLELSDIDPLLVKIVEMRYFAGLTEAEIAEAVQLSTRTVRRHWQKAVIFLRTSLA